ncbi:MAG: hypothetical protein ACI8PZ_006529 [Myxococcota bacterium]|jgi:hypothetical protein
MTEIVVFLFALPVAWPVLLWRTRAQLLEHNDRMAKVEADSAPALAALRDGRADAALVSTRTWRTMASGPEDEACVGVLVDDEERWVPWSTELESALKLAQVPIQRHEVRELGLAMFPGWAAWAAATVGYAALGWTGCQ